MLESRDEGESKEERGRDKISVGIERQFTVFNIFFAVPMKYRHFCNLGACQVIPASVKYIVITWGVRRDVRGRVNGEGRQLKDTRGKESVCQVLPCFSNMRRHHLGRER